MNERDGQALLIKLWLEKAKEALSSAQLELDAGHTSFAVNRLYYTCFYAVTALFQKGGMTFKRHTGVIAEFNRAYVKTGQIESK
ncbi:MAG: HEPN domain-containing protein, partial [Planctomycetes bacterium]|nr:HEPN domain-containing protein [Planctomycetota bacterium]